MDELPAELSLEQEIALLRQQLTTLRIDLSGKDWLTVEEAAHYCGVSVSQFNTKAGEYDLSPRQFMGKSSTRRTSCTGLSTAPAAGDRGTRRLLSLRLEPPHPRWLRHWPACGARGRSRRSLKTWQN